MLFPMEQKDASGQAEELQDPVSPLVCTQLTSLLSAKSYLGVLPIGSDECLSLRSVCAGKCFGIQCQLGGFVAVLPSGVLDVFHLCDWYSCCLL